MAKARKQTTKKKLRLAVLMGGPSAERSVSLASGRNVMAYLDRAQYQPRSITIGRTDEWRRKVTPANTDLVFIALHGAYGEDGRIQGYLEVVGLPYTGSGVTASALGMNKVLSKRIFQNAGIAVPNGHVLSSRREPLLGIPTPAVVKPVDSGSSIGVSIVQTAAELRTAVAEALARYPSILVEPFVAGRELTVPVLGNVRPRALPVIEIKPRSQPFFNYQAKYQPGGAIEETPARVPDVVRQQAQRLAVACHETLGCRGYSRTDMILTERGDLKVLEINTLPGLTQASLLPKSAAAAGLPFAQLLDEIIALARA